MQVRASSAIWIVTGIVVELPGESFENTHYNRLTRIYRLWAFSVIDTIAARAIESSHFVYASTCSIREERIAGYGEGVTRSG